MEKYAELSVLNEGSYGVVQLVRQLSTSRMYAAKRVSLELSSRSEIDDEIRVHELVAEHPRVVHLVDHFLDEVHNEYVLIIEYCSGGDLHDAIARGEKPTHAGLKKIMIQLLDTLQYCHAAHIYHRDIKPENIFLQPNGNIKLGDWGLATTNQYCHDFGTGSEQYMAPECFDRSAKYYDAAAADIWAAGIVLVNILFGRNPFKQATERDPLFKDFASSRETLYDIFPALTSDVYKVLRHSLALNPDHRSLTKMREALMEVENWSTDDELQRIEERMLQKKKQQREEELMSKVVVERTAAKMVPVVHKPFRVPTAVAQSLKSPSTPWDRRKMYTPPTKTFAWPHAGSLEGGHPHSYAGSYATSHAGSYANNLSASYSSNLSGGQSAALPGSLPPGSLPRSAHPASYTRSSLPRHLEEPEEEEREDDDDDELEGMPSLSPSSTSSDAYASKRLAFGDTGIFSMDDEHEHPETLSDADEEPLAAYLDSAEGLTEPADAPSGLSPSSAFTSYRDRKLASMYR